jgi:glycosyltransferase involved in cell wall biosynthesis
MARVARRVAALSSARGMHSQAAAALRLTGRLVGPGRLRADLMGEAADLELSRGREPRGLVAAYAARLACADDLYRSGDTKRAAASLIEATQLAFHRVPHIDRLSSPLDRDPRRYTEPMHRSVAARAVAAPRGRKSPAAPPAEGRPLRLLIVTRGNANFLPVIMSHYERHPGVELRHVDLAEDPAIAKVLGLRPMVEFVLGGLPDYERKVEEVLRLHLDWADTVFVEWCTVVAASLTLVDPGTTRIVVRLHKYETYTYWPHCVDFSRVDDLIFIAEPMRCLTVATVPRLTEADAPRLHMIANAMDLAKFQRPKRADARFTLGLVGIGQIAKDPRWALEVLRRLRSSDVRYRMVIMGGGVDPQLSAATRHYHDLLERDLAALEPSGAVRRLGHVDDVPAAMTEVGVILSSSVREGSHNAFVEGAASGAVPVVRDWPCFARQPHNVRTLFPADWVVDSPREAAERILALTADEETWSKAGQAATEHVLRVWDWSVVQHDFDRLLLPGETAGSLAEGAAGSLAE